MKGKDRDSNSYSARNWLFCNLGVGSRSFSMGSSQHRDWTQVSCIACGFFTIWATREAQSFSSGLQFYLWNGVIKLDDL